MNMVIEIFSEVYFGNTLLAWIYFFTTIISFVIVAKSTLYFTKSFGRRITKKIKGNLDDVLIDLLEEPFVFSIVIFGIMIGYNFLVFNDTINFYFYNVINILFILAGTWLILRLIDALVENYINPLTKKTESKYDEQLVPIIKKTLKFITVCLAAIIALDNFGIDVMTLIAGLGIGGIAFAFAAQKTIADAFGGLSILLSKPFIVGDTIDAQDVVGTVEEIGLRHTKIRNLEKRLVIIPNSNLSGSIITNISSAPKRKTVWTIGLTYNTSVKKIEQAKKIIEKAIIQCKLCDKEPIIAFDGFGDSSLNILIVFFTKTGGWGDMVKAKNEVGLYIKKEFEKAKIEFAFPTQTIHLKK
jgi:MscS family membrane protein